MIAYALTVALVLIIPGCTGKLEIGIKPPTGSMWKVEELDNFEERGTDEISKREYLYKASCEKYTTVGVITTYRAKLTVAGLRGVIDYAKLDSCEDLNQIRFGHPILDEKEHEMHHVVYFGTSPGECVEKHYFKEPYLHPGFMDPRGHTTDAFKELQQLTLPCLYIMETTTYRTSKCVLAWGRDVHEYNTSGRDNNRTGQHRTLAGVQIVNKLPEPFKNVRMPKAFKNHLNFFVASRAFYDLGVVDLAAGNTPPSALLRHPHIALRWLD